MAEITGAEPGAIRLMGLRDLASAASLVVAHDPRAAIAARVAFDTSDAVTFTRRRPLIGAVAIAYGLLGVLALRAGRNRAGQ